MRCAGPCSIAERLARNIGVAQQARACSRLTLYSAECVEKLSEKGFEQRSEGGFGRYTETKWAFWAAHRVTP